MWTLIKIRVRSLFSPIYRPHLTSSSSDRSASCVTRVQNAEEKLKKEEEAEDTEHAGMRKADRPTSAANGGHDSPIINTAENSATPSLNERELM
uniref:Uncharacterized protein n=1 Tax=Caenorhabditis japonica TaxID=281687 RepID=A0A8R1EMR2_CAEJA